MPKQKDFQQMTFDYGTPPLGQGQSSNQYDRRKNREARRQAEMSAEGRDIGDIPAIGNPDRREHCKGSLKNFCETYFPEIFYLPWSEFQIETINRIQATVLHGGKFALAMPRGSGKTTICERAAIWAAVYGYRKFIVTIGATDQAAREMFQSIKSGFDVNEALQADFPEVCFPIGALEGITNRCKGQTYYGERTHIEWNDLRMVLPTIGEAPTGGTVLSSTSMTGRIRGMKFPTADGHIIRPDLVIIDDPQTRESAKSVTQIKDRMNLINSDILGLAGPGKKITAFIPCTVIYPNDLADQLLNRELNPEWSGKRFKFMDGFPKNFALWQRYCDIRSASQRIDEGVEEANRFYITNRIEMDEGCKATWPDRFNHDEVSSIQHAMNLYFLDKQMFMSEYQNEPLAMDLGDSERVMPEHVFKSMNKRARREIPQAASKLTFFIDVQKNLLYWTIMAFSDDFTSWLIDYGTYPEQPRPIFTTNDAAPTYMDIYPQSGLEGAMTAALHDCILPILGTSYMREDGAELNISRCMIDSGWGDSTDTIYNFIRESGQAGIILPSKGVGINATVAPFSEYRRRPGETISQYEWHIAPVKNKRHVRLLRYDTNYWKSFFRNRIFTSRGDPGSFSLFGEQVTDSIRLLADQLASEYSIAESARGRRVDVWKLTPTRENHWLDCVVGCMVAASEQGCRLLIDPPTAANKAPRLPPPPMTSTAPTPRNASYTVARSYSIGKSF